MELERLAESFEELASNSDSPSEGLVQIAQGLQALVRDIQAGVVSKEFVEPLGEALSALEGLLGGEEKPETSAPGLERFVNAFVLEAQKRMAGLSLSINGIFDSDNAEAVRMSAEHLHAIRGGAAMLSLKDIARLAGALEHCIISFGRAGDQATPTRPILRSFAVLKSALENPDQPIDALVDDVIEELEAAIEALKKPNPFQRTPTATDTRILEQRILVVDDVVTIASSIGFILSELDIPVDVANSGRQALEMLHQGAYSLVISDVSMPDMDGYQLIEEMKRDPLLEDVPVILLTQLDTPAERARGMAAGANDYIVKGSIGGGELVARVSDLLIDAPYVPTIARPERRSILIVEDTETIAASIAFVLSEGPFDIEIAHNGLDAIKLLSKRVFDLVLSDIEMPSMNGLELLTAMKAEPRLASIPFVVLTSRSSGANAEEALRLGATRFMVKGDVAAENLLKVVTEILDS